MSDIFLINNSDVPIEEFNMLLSTEPEGWGNNWLTSPLEPGGIFELSGVPGGIYDLRARFTEDSFVKSLDQVVNGGLYAWTVSAAVFEPPQLEQVDEVPLPAISPAP